MCGAALVLEYKLNKRFDRFDMGYTSKNKGQLTIR